MHNLQVYTEFEEVFKIFWRNRSYSLNQKYTSSLVFFTLLLSLSVSLVQNNTHRCAPVTTTQQIQEEREQNSVKLQWVQKTGVNTVQVPTFKLNYMLEINMQIK